MCLVLVFFFCFLFVFFDFFRKSKKKKHFLVINNSGKKSAIFCPMISKYRALALCQLKMCIFFMIVYILLLFFIFVFFFLLKMFLYLLYFVLNAVSHFCAVIGSHLERQRAISSTLHNFFYNILCLYLSLYMYEIIYLNKKIVFAISYKCGEIMFIFFQTENFENV